MFSRKVLLRTYTSADLAESDSDKADFSVIMTGGFTSWGDLIMLEKWSKTGSDPIEVLTEFIRQMRMYHCFGGFIEKNRFESIMRTCRKLVRLNVFGNSTETMKIVNKIRQIPHYGVSKMDRFRDNLGSFINSGKLMIPSHWDDVKDFILKYPAVENDDIGDSLDMLVEYGEIPRQTFQDKLPRAGSVYDEHSESSQNINSYFAAKKVNIYTGVAN